MKYKKKILWASIVFMQNLPCRIYMLPLVSLYTAVIRDLSHETFPFPSVITAPITYRRGVQVHTLVAFFPSYNTVSLYLAIWSLLSQVVLPLPVNSYSPLLPSGICIYPVLVICYSISFPSFRHCLIMHFTQQVGSFPSVKGLTSA